MGVGYQFDLPVVNHNRNLNSKEQKIDYRARLRATMGEREPIQSSVVIIIVI